MSPHEDDESRTASGTTPLPTGDRLHGLDEALESYDRALMSNDMDALSTWFLASPKTLRADPQGVLVGHQQIDDFRRSSTGAPARRITELHVVELSSGEAAVTMAETERPDGTQGVQTQAWTRTEDGWRIAAAHVSVGQTTGVKDANETEEGTGETSTRSGSAIDDPRVWRVSGAPLVPANRHGALDGLTLAIKDLFAVKGQRMGLGNPAWLKGAQPEPRHAGVVQTLLDAGAEITGIAQTDEFAYSLSGTNVHYGTPPNPLAEGRVPGGSSSGPASATALGQVDVGLGSDTAGSIRVPAAYCGLYGIRPTHGALSTVGLAPLAPMFDTAGWFTRDAVTLERVGDVLLPAGQGASIDKILLAEDVFGFADPEVAKAARAAATELATHLGISLIRVTELCEGRMDDWVQAFGRVQSAEAWSAHGWWVEDHLDSLAPDIAQRFLNGRAITPGAKADGMRTLLAARVHLWDQITPGTVLAQPAASTVAPPPTISAKSKAKMRAGTLRLTSIASVGGLPAVTMPAGTAEGLPVGLCLVGPSGSDRELIALASATASAL